MAALAAMLSACTDEPQALKTLEGAGFTEIKITGYSYFGCGKEDTFHTGFEARGPKGQFVQGVVCSGWMKGSTIRFE